MVCICLQALDAAAATDITPHHLKGRDATAGVERQPAAAVIQFEFDRCLHSALLDHLLALQVQTNLSDDNGPGVCFSFAVR